MVDRQKIIQIFKASPTPTSIVKADDPDFTFLQVNDAYTEMTQRDEKDLIGHSLFEAFPANPGEEKPTGVDRLRKSFQKVIATKQADEMPRIRYDIMLGDSFAQVYWKVINTPVFGDDDEVEFIVNSATNITTQVRNEHINNLMLNNSEDSFIYINRDLIIQGFNNLFADNYKDIFGIEVNTGDSIIEYAQPERRETVKNIYERVFKGEIVEGELPVETPEGNSRFFNIKYKPARDGQNNIIGSFISLLEKTEEQSAKLALEKNEARFRALVENGGDVLFILSAEGNPTYASPSIQHVLGYSPDEVLKMDMFDAVHPEDIPMMKAEIQKSLEQPGNPIKVPPARLKDKKGNWHWFEGTITNMLHDPAIDGIVDNFREITERVKAEKEIENAKKQYQSLIQSINGIVWEADAESFVFNYVSPQVKDILGYNPEDWVGTAEFWVDKIHPDDRDEAVRYCQNQTQKGLNHSFEYRMRKAEGTYIWIRDIVTVIQENGVPSALRGLMMDITETKKAQTELRKAEEKFRNVVEHSTNMFYQHDAEGVLNYVSPQSKQFLGYSPEKAMRDWTEFITDHPTNAKGEKITQRAIETGEVQEPYELQLITADNRIIWVEVNEAPLKENGEVVGIVGSLTDITERKLYEEELQRSLERYDYASKASRDAIYDWDIVNDNLHWGEGFNSLFGHQPGDGAYPLKKYSESVHPDDNAEALKDLEFTLKDSSMNKWSYEYRFQKADGRYAHVVENGYIIRDEDGEAIRMIGAIKDITEDKQAEIQTKLQHQVAQFFKNEDRLNPILDNLLDYLTKFGNFNLAEIWLVSGTGSHLNLMSYFANDAVGRKFYSKSEHITRFKFGEGLPGIAWKNNSIETWENLSETNAYVRRDAAEASGLDTTSALPLYHNEEVIGVLVLGSEESAEKVTNKIHPYEILQDFIGAEIRRKQQEEEMLLLFESSPDILAITSPDKQFVKVNPGFSKILGYTEKELTSQNFENFIHPDDRPETFEEYEENIIGERKANNFTNRYITKSGDIRYISWSSSGVFGEDGFMFAFGRDVTDRKLAEQKIVEANEKLKTAQEIAQLGYWEHNLETNELYLSHEVYKIWGIDPQKNIQSNEEFREYIHPEDLVNFDKQQKIALSGEKELDIEYRIVLPDGTIKWVHEIGSTVSDKDGKIIAFEGTVQDITEGKNAAIDLEEANKEKENILNSIGDGFFTLDKNWNVTYWNRAAERLFQTPKQEILDQNIWDIFEDAIDLPSYTNYHRVMHQNIQVSFEDYYEPIDKWFDINAYPSEEGISVFFKDITESKKARQALEELNIELEMRAQELAASNAELEQFAYVASHDLQEPLRMVSSFLTQLDKKYSDELDEKANQYIHFAVDGAQRMRQIILDLLNYSRLNQEKSKRENVDLNIVLEDVKALERSHIEQTKAEISADNLPTINANPGPIKQLFQNLINNALKYQESGNQPIVEISCSETDSHWEFAVNDNGIGINDEFQHTIFQIFQRLHTRDQYSGTGIGLAISKKIVERHGGEIWLESEEGKGSTFFFTISKE